MEQRLGMAALTARRMAFPRLGASRVYALAGVFLLALFGLIAHTYSTGTLTEAGGSLLHALPNPLHPAPVETPRNTFAPPRRKPTPTWTPPAQTEPFPALASSTGAPPEVPLHNRPRPDMHVEYGLTHAPPLFIGFTRQWAVLLQAVVSYITAGWPPASIYVVENTGVQGANAAGRLSLQNPFYLNHTTLKRLGVNVVETPVLLSFAQLQNFFLHLAKTRSWPYYFYSHQDVLVFSLEDGADDTHRPGDRAWEFDGPQDEADAMRPPAAGQPGYRTIYENCLREINHTVATDKRWAFRWFQYDHLALVNRAALDAIGGWDSLIPYYLSDCDMNARLVMEGWSMRHRRVGIVNDIASTLADLGALYRDPRVVPKFVDPNPFVVPPPPEGEDGSKQPSPPPPPPPLKPVYDAAGANLSDPVEYFRALVRVGSAMGEHKYGNRGRNTWQASQRGGFGEPYYYDPVGFATAFDILTEAGREVYRRKWGHRDCDLVEGTALKLWDQWLVEKDWD